MRDAGILVAPCDVEGLGLSVLEAMASGLPVVAAGTGGHLELLDGVGEVCLPAADAGSMAASLARLGADPALRDAVAGTALARQRSLLALDAQAAATLDVYLRELDRTDRAVTAS
jgi:glycosyltransferase involved in cell wall biosynthesis